MQDSQTVQDSLKNSTRQFQTVQERIKTIKKNRTEKEVLYSARQFQTVQENKNTVLVQEGSTQCKVVSDSARQFKKQYCSCTRSFNTVQGSIRQFQTIRKQYKKVQHSTRQFPTVQDNSRNRARRFNRCKTLSESAWHVQ